MDTPSSPVYGTYEKEHLDKVAFPLGGIGSGMICIEGNGAFSAVSLRHRPQVHHEPLLFAAVAVKGAPGKLARARVLAGPVQRWKIQFPWGETFHSSGDGGRDNIYGFPHFDEARFSARFPFAEVSLSDAKFPLRVQIQAWSPFIPNEADDSSLPAAGVEYRFSNPGAEPVEAVFSFHAANFMAVGAPENGGRVTRTARGFALEQPGCEERPWEAGHFAAWIDEEGVKVNPAWFRGGWFDPATMVWKSIANAECIDRPEAEGKPSRGGSLYLPLRLAPGEEKCVVLKWAWYVPFSNVQAGGGNGFYRPWYAAAFADPHAVEDYWRKHYAALRAKTALFTDAFYDSTLPPEVLDAVSANLSILKSPTVLRQADGRVWAWEGCHDAEGSCSGTCTHVWNYAQALAHLFPALERGLRQTEFFDAQNDQGHQNFRAALPIGPVEDHTFHAAADGQLGGIIKVYRDWRISGDLDWLKRLWPRVKQSLAYCIETWDPDHKGTLAEPHHNTYDIEFWGEDGMCGSIYLGALAAAAEMSASVGDPEPLYGELLASGRARLADRLFNGAYFQQNIQWKGLRAKDPVQAQSSQSGYSPEALALLEAEGPKYQYGTGCLSDGVIGAWMGWAAGLAPFLDSAMVGRHLDSVFQHNFQRDLSEHANPQRSGYALGHEAGLLLCTWPRGGRLSLPLPYSEEVWTGIEYQVASHLLSMGRVDEGLQIVRAVRARYDGRIRNPFNEYECGHWYARAMASYALLQGLTGARYDAVEQTLYLDPKIPGDFRAFLSTATGFGTVGVRDGKPFLEIKAGQIDVKKMELRE
ncbi:MAG: GH116 family glycosyl hydrolase [Chthoniobacteraceae bacterium]|nr:GH116 family glycosyl hydrolase [Chthoniobacteraceae bacterium]